MIVVKEHDVDLTGCNILACPRCKGTNIVLTVGEQHNYSKDKHANIHCKDCFGCGKVYTTKPIDCPDHILRLDLITRWNLLASRPIAPTKGIYSLIEAVLHDNLTQFGFDYCSACNPSVCEQTFRDYLKTGKKCWLYEEKGRKLCETCQKMFWILDRAKMYSEHTGLSVEEILAGWEGQRNYWFMNFYQENNQPEITDGPSLMFFDTLDDYKNFLGTHKFICPKCKRITFNHYRCEKEGCGWSSDGFITFGTLRIFVKDVCKFDRIFPPAESESDKNN